MSFYAGRIPNFIKAPTNDQLQKLLMKLSVALDSKLEIISLYESTNGGLICWYFYDTKKMALGNLQENFEVKPKKKTRRKKG